MKALKNEIISCARCGLDIARLKRDLKSGHQILESDLAGIHYQPKNGELCNCKECKHPWLLDGDLHIKGVGWV